MKTGVPTNQPSGFASWISFQACLEVGHRPMLWARHEGVAGHRDGMRVGTVARGRLRFWARRPSAGCLGL